MRAELEQYIQLNDDLPRETAIGMAPFALRRVIGKDGVSKLFSIDPKTPWAHYSWFWWQCLVHSGLEHMWFADELNEGLISLRTWQRRLIYRATQEEQTLFLKRYYATSIQPRGKSLKKKNGQRKLWTKGGIWDEKGGMSKILVLGEHLERPHKMWSAILGPEIKLIERELRQVADPNRWLYPEAYLRALEYVRERTRPYYGTNKSMSWPMMAWFFQQDIQRRDGKWFRTRGTQNWNRNSSRIVW